MSLFRRAGRRVERLRRSVEGAVDDAATHACAACGRRYYAERDACEACGGDVEALEADEAGDAVEAPDDGVPADGATADAADGDDGD